MYRSLGKVLASLEGVHVVTGGFKGVGDTVGRSCHKERQRVKNPSVVWHVLPEAHRTRPA